MLIKNSSLLTHLLYRYQILKNINKRKNLYIMFSSLQTNENNVILIVTSHVNCSLLLQCSISGCNIP